MKIIGNTVGTPLKPEKIISDLQKELSQNNSIVFYNYNIDVPVGLLRVIEYVPSLASQEPKVGDWLLSLNGCLCVVAGAPTIGESGETKRISLRGRAIINSEIDQIVEENGRAISDLQKTVGEDGGQPTGIFLKLSDVERVNEEQAEAIEELQANSGAAVYYHTTREEVGKAHDDINAAYIFSLYDALMETYPDRVQKVEHANDDGTFTNYEYVISTGQYTTDGVYSQFYGKDNIRKPKYLILSGIHGTEGTAVLSAYRFVRDMLSGHNVPASFREGIIISIMPVGNPSGLNAFKRQNDNAVDINRNFDCNWVKGQNTDEDGDTYTYGSSAASEKETQAIVNWLEVNKDADLYIDFHNSGALNEKVLVLGLPDDSRAELARKIALRGIDRIIPFWRDVIGYPDTVEVFGITDTDGDGSTIEERDVIFSYSAAGVGGPMSYSYAHGVKGIPSFTLETAVYYGDYSEWAANKKVYSTEAIAMGAEALGNILIEHYVQYCEVITMSKIDNKLDMLIQQVNSGFRVESGTIVLEEDLLPESGEVYFTYKIPCTNGAKIATFYADGDTLSAIKSTTGTPYYISMLLNGFEPMIQNANGVQSGLFFCMQEFIYNGASYGWIPANGSTMGNNTDGFSFNCMALKAGTYHWKAYYWND